MEVNIKYDRRKLIRASIYTRQNGPAYLSYLAIGDVWSMLQTFIAENYLYLANETYLKRPTGNYAHTLSSETKNTMADALARSPIFNPANHLTLFPLVPISVEANFQSNSFVLLRPASLQDALAHLEPIDGTKFPPFLDWKGIRKTPRAWLGVRAPTIAISYKIRGAILGAIALTPVADERYLFSGREMFGGHCTIDDGYRISLGPAHTPPLMHDITITGQDHRWLSTLANMFENSDGDLRRQIQALEYFYRAWSLDQSDRFAILCMTLDAIFGRPKLVTQAVIEGVRGVLGSQMDDTRLRQLMKLRGDVIHGRAPAVYDAQKYGQYYSNYEADPIHDLELVVASCLRKKIFGGTLAEHVNPNAAIIAAAQAKGQLPKNMSRSNILG